MSVETSEPAPALQPTRDPRVTLSDLVDVLLDKGVYLDLDVIIGVADIPLIGLNLKATLAGMETMLEYGMMQEWDQRTREWVQRSLVKDLDLGPDEELIAKTAGGYLVQEGRRRTWRPGSVYLTTQRLLVFRRDPRETLWQTPLNQLASAGVIREQSIGGDERDRLEVTTQNGQRHLLSAADPARFARLLHQHVPQALTESAGHSPAEGLSGQVWYLQQLAGRSEWRGGSASVDDEHFTWTAVLEDRAAARIRLDEITEVSALSEPTPAGDDSQFRIRTQDQELVFGSQDAQWWASQVEAARTAGTGPSARPREVNRGAEYR